MKFEKTPINTLKRGAKKASYDKEVVYGILDATEICHIAFTHNGKAFVQPINFGRFENKIYLHGAYSNRMTTALIAVKEVCLNVTILDAMKLTRSAFHHSVNYRSVVVFGRVKELISDEDKLHGLKCIINHFVPNRWEHCRLPNQGELKATRVLEISIETASAKIADTPPTDNKADLELDYWAGIIPVKTICEYPKPDMFMKKDVKIPKHILDFYANKKG
ncbi:MAG: pyridoxamine 5'-phosphate oxidase family protein [Flavobacteriaceae bacterium]